MATKNGASTCNLYIDGVDVSGVVTDQTLANTAGAHNLGRELQTANQPWTGDISYFGMLNANMTPAVVVGIYNSYLQAVNQIGQASGKGRSENMYPNNNGRSRFRSGAQG